MLQNAVAEASIDFGREALVLLQATQGSGSNIVTFGAPSLTDRTLTLQQKIEMRGNVATADEAYDCYLLVVQLEAVDAVVFEQDTLDLRGKRNEPLPRPSN